MPSKTPLASTGWWISAARIMFSVIKTTSIFHNFWVKVSFLMGLAWSQIKRNVKITGCCSKVLSWFWKLFYALVFRRTISLRIQPLNFTYNDLYSRYYTYSVRYIHDAGKRDDITHPAQWPACQRGSGPLCHGGATGLDSHGTLCGRRAEDEGPCPPGERRHPHKHHIPAPANKPIPVLKHPITGGYRCFWVTAERCSIRSQTEQ